MTFPIIISSNSSNEFLTDGNSPQLQPNVKVENKNMKVKKYFIQISVSSNLQYLSKQKIHFNRSGFFYFL